MRVVEHREEGIAAAYDAGLAAARAEWVLFVDAGDSLTPDGLERLAAAAVEASGIDAVHGDWLAAAPGRGTWAVERAPRDRDLFDVAAQRAPFPLHTCLVRAALVREAGGFDSSLAVHAAWDLWQRLARGGARFAPVAEVVAVCGAGDGGASADAGERGLSEALRLIDRGHAADPRVPRSLAAHAIGRARPLFAGAAYGALVSGAAGRIGQGGDAREL